MRTRGYRLNSVIFWFYQTFLSSSCFASSKPNLKRHFPGRTLNSNRHQVEFFPRFVGGGMVNHPHREPMLLSYLLPLNRHASSPLLPTRRHLYIPSVTNTTQTLLPSAIPNQLPYFIQPVDHLVDWQNNPARAS